MSDGLSPKGQFEPIHAAHSIEHVVFVLRFESSLDDEIFAQVRNAAKKFETEADMPRREKQPGISFTVQAAGQLPATSVQISGLMLQRMRADGSIEKELRFDHNSIAFKTSLYTSWDMVWLQAKSYFEALAPIYAPHTKIAGVGLNYVDKFEWVGDRAKCRVDDLLRVGSDYLCPHIFNAKDFWHSHTGVFIRADKQTKRLLNVNVDYLDENRADELCRVISVTTVLTDLFNQSTFDPLGVSNYESLEVSAENIVKFFDDHITELHVFSKKIVGYVINDKMNKRIALIG